MFHKYGIVFRKTNFFHFQLSQSFLRVKSILLVLSERKFHYYPFIFFTYTMARFNIIFFDMATNIFKYFQNLFLQVAFTIITRYTHQPYTITSRVLRICPTLTLHRDYHFREYRMHLLSNS